MGAPATAGDLARLLVPLSVFPGLDPVGLYVWVRDGGGICTHGPSDVRNGYTVSDRGGGWMWVEVDLADGHTRDRVVRWLAGRVRLPVGSTAPHLHVGGWDHPERGPSRWGRLVNDRGEEWHFDLPPDFRDTDESVLPDGSECRLALALVQAAQFGVRPVDLVGTARRFGPTGPAYVVVGFRGDVLDVVIPETGERLEVPYAQAVADPTA